MSATARIAACRSVAKHAINGGMIASALLLQAKRPIHREALSIQPMRGGQQGDNGLAEGILYVVKSPQPLWHTLGPWDWESPGSDNQTSGTGPFV